jgi:hypothetical protein
MIQETEGEEGRLAEDLVEEWTEKFSGHTINSIRVTVKVKRKKKVIGAEQMLEAIDTTSIESSP